MGSKRGELWLPAGMYIDENDKIYVADQYNRRVNIYQYMGENTRQRRKGSKELIGLSKTICYQMVAYIKLIIDI